MPELPEVETVRRDLQSLVDGAVVSSVRISGRRSVRRRPATFASLLVGRSFAGFRRWGKYLLIDLSSSSCLVVHLRMSGQLLVSPSGGPFPRHTHVAISLTDGRSLLFVDPRTFGEMFVSPDLAELSSLGPDALTADLAAVVRGRRARLKPLLLDQRAIAGIGNIYSDEILFRAGLRWSRPALSLRPVEVSRLGHAVREVLTEAIDARGSTLRDAQYVDVAGRQGAFQDRHAVYDRLGAPCVRCGRPIERIRVAQRSHYWCRRCQK